MNVLGINTGIGPSVCLLRDGKVIFAMEEERLNREKNTMGFPTLLLQHLEEEYGDFLSSLDKVAIANHNFSFSTLEQFRRKYNDKLYGKGIVASMKDRAWLAKEFLKSLVQKNNVNSYKDQEKVISMIANSCPSIALDKSDYEFIKHHDCHAGAAYFGLAQHPDREYLVLTLDGGGDRECATVQVGNKAALRRVASTPSGNSIGNIYSITTFLMGMTPHEHEYKIMGLAAYVPQQYRDYAAKIFQPFLTLDKDKQLTFCSGKAGDTKFIHKTLEKALHRQRFDNVSAGLQQFTENLVVAWVKACIEETGIRDVLLSGGVFMNVAMNKKIAELPDINSLGVFPSCGDETNSFGSAFTVYARHTGKFPEFNTFMLGSDPCADTDALIATYKDRCDFRYVQDSSSAAADLLAEGKIIARCAGRMEFGARALGNRSVLADPMLPNAVERINSTIKQRDFWMPFAPAILIDDIHEHVIVPTSLKGENPSPYMMIVMDTFAEKQPHMVAALHRNDKTARVEVVDSKHAADFYDLISAFKKKTGRSCVLNTSFNVHGHPIVRTSSQALDILINSTLDAVVLDNYIVSKKEFVENSQ